MASGGRNMQRSQVNAALNALAERFRERDWSYYNVPEEAIPVTEGVGADLMFHWHAGDDEIQICVFKGKRIEERFHRQDFFFLNYAYRGGFTALSGSSDNRISLHENDCYVGQPFSAYALECSLDKRGCVIIGVLIRKDAFFRTFLPVLSVKHELYRFFIEPQENEFATRSLQVSFDEPDPMRTLLELMVCEYAHPQEDSQTQLKALALAAFVQVARRCESELAIPQDNLVSDRVIRYLASHPEVTTLKAVASHFAYHPNYLSGLLRKETGKTFSAILTEQRMGRARELLSGTDLRVDEVARMLGYHSTSNFYRTFREYFGEAPSAARTTGARCTR